MNQKRNISDNIRVIRENSGYSQEYMAAKLNLTQQAYSHIEKNPEKSTLMRLKEIAQILQVNLSLLINEETAYFQQNYHQKGGNAASQLHVFANNDVYENLISKMENEITFLKEVVKDLSKK
jgi:transcriptional regulator with XRE-family HTH domain